MSIFLWWLAVTLIGVAFMPFSNSLFHGFKDGGWLFSKAAGIFISGWLLWVLNVLHVLSFVQKNCILAVLVCFLLNLLYLYFVFFRKKKSFLDGISLPLILAEEGMFLFLLLFFIYLIGFRPSAYGTEKFMDYSFLTSMMRTLWLPFKDVWYSGEKINYYYGGQYFTVYLIKLSGIGVGVGYNIMRATETAFSFMLPFSLIFEMMRDKAGKRKLAPWIAGLISGFAVAFCGNFHYVIYGIILKIVNAVNGTAYQYWFSDSTRYIGYNPDTADKTIHEFPSYSSVLGDLHAHFLNIMFVVTVVAIAYGFARRTAEKCAAGSAAVKPLQKSRRPSRAGILKEALLQPEVIAIGFFTGLFKWTNFWDFPIYFIVCGSVIFFMNFRLYRENFPRFFIVMALQAIEAFAAGFAACLPFTLTFRQISSEIHLTHSHSLLYQLLILWGLPFAAMVGFIIILVMEMKKKTRETGVKRYITFDADTPDLVIFLLSLCAAGLVLLPEFIYVKDIYTESHYRANTMFKLTYQAFILFGMSMGYIFTRAVLFGKKAVFRFGIAGLICLALTGGYIFQACRDWFGKTLDSSARVSTDASVFVSLNFASDFDAISYLNSSVSGQPVVLEAPGDSYSEYERVSVATGLPTVLGWYVHEWLWRGDTTALNARAADVQSIYTSADKTMVSALIEKYNISYIYVGTLERQKYENLNDTLIQSLGKVVYSDGASTYIVKVG